MRQLPEEGVTLGRRQTSAAERNVGNDKHLRGRVRGGRLPGVFDLARSTRQTSTPWLRSVIPPGSA